MATAASVKGRHNKLAKAINDELLTRSSLIAMREHNARLIEFISRQNVSLNEMLMVTRNTLAQMGEGLEELKNEYLALRMM